jgi:hypothetical protein
MEEILSAKERGVLKWSGSIASDSQFPISRPAILDSEEAFQLFAKRVKYCHKSKNRCTMKVDMENPNPRKKDPSAVGLGISGNGLNTSH